MANSDSMEALRSEILNEIAEIKKASEKSRRQAEKILKREDKSLAKLAQLETLISEADFSMHKEKKGDKKSAVDKAARKRTKKSGHV